jgi:hypothetical protein
MMGLERSRVPPFKMINAARPMAPMAKMHSFAVTPLFSRLLRGRFVCLD